MKNTDFTIVVATSDEFQDCWTPFFVLFKKYWPNCDHRIILSTGEESFVYPGLDIHSAMADRRSNEKATWSQRLLVSLDSVKTELVLLLLDDFFLNGPVDVETVNECCRIMQDEQHSLITLTNHDTMRRSKPTANPLLEEIDRKSPYRVSTSPALWRKTSLMSYLRPSENVWMFEIFGTRRSYRIKDSFYRVNDKQISKRHAEVIPYFQTDIGDTGIIKGGWQHGIEPLFESSGITINYAERGYYKNLPSLLNKYYLIRKLLQHPRQLVPGLLGK